MTIWADKVTPVCGCSRLFRAVVSAVEHQGDELQDQLADLHIQQLLQVRPVPMSLLPALLCLQFCDRHQSTKYRKKKKSHAALVHRSIVLAELLAAYHAP